MNDIVFIDTCIVIDFINCKIQLDSKAIQKCCINTIVDMEVLVGVRDKRDLHTTNKKLNFFKNIEIDQEILNFARNLLDRYTLSHGMSVYDAIIAATCLVYDLPLWTHNKKDFRYVNGLRLIENLK